LGISKGAKKGAKKGAHGDQGDGEESSALLSAKGLVATLLEGLDAPSVTAYIDTLRNVSAPCFHMFSLFPNIVVLYKVPIDSLKYF
jgi:hypothetical protein